MEEPDLGPMPEPRIEPGEPNPGGVDAIDVDDAPPAVPDLGPDRNPAAEDAVPDEIKQPDDTDTEATDDGASNPTQESPA
jgi:hypothetical protein